MTAYYNENDPKAAAWLRQLIAGGHIAWGIVDERSIEDVKPSDLKGFTQCHFFAGIGGWSLALRMAGWPDSRPVWTGSCPCQPFSAAGKGTGTDDPRHLWPAWQWLIDRCRPATVFGEQVASKAGREWFKAVQTDLQGMGYAAAAADICAAGVGAPHWRQRLWFVGVADSDGARLPIRNDRTDEGSQQSKRSCGSERMADDQPQQHQIAATPHHDARGRDEEPTAVAGFHGTRQLADSTSGHPGAEREQRSGEHGLQPEGGRTERVADGACGGLSGSCGKSGAQDQRITERGGRTSQPEPFASALNSFWADADWLYCTDGKWRPVEPGLEPLAHGLPGRVGLLRGYGNAIVPQVAAEFIKAVIS